MEAQYPSRIENTDGSKTFLGTLLLRLNIFFTIFFTLELGVTAFSNWFIPLLSDGWYLPNARPTSESRRPDGGCQVLV